MYKLILFGYLVFYLIISVSKGAIYVDDDSESHYQLYRNKTIYSVPINFYIERGILKHLQSIQPNVTDVKVYTNRYLLSLLESVSILIFYFQYLKSFNSN